MYEPSRHIETFYISGFQHHEGALVLEKLKAGKKLRLVPEMDNPHDAEAVAIYYKQIKLGYIPGEKNSLVSVASYYGHESMFECRVLQADPEADPWKQVRVGLYVSDAR